MDNINELNIVNYYEYMGQKIDYIPSDILSLEKCKPVLKSFQPWNKSTYGCTKLKDLPYEARKYIEFIENYINVPLKIISTGPKRDEAIFID